MTPNCDFDEESSSSKVEKKLERNKTGPPETSSRTAKLRSQMTSKSVFDEELSASDAASEEMETDETGNAPGNSKAAAKKHKCPQCPRQYKRERDMLTHMRVHDKNKQIKCQVCQVKVFATKQEHDQHMLTHTGEKLHECPICHRWFGRRSHLKSHQYIHLEEKTFKCPECPGDKYFRSPNQLSAHMILHGPEKRHECPVCHKKFHLGSSLKIHARIHIRAKPYGCEVCGARFTQSGHLSTHVRTHSGEKPFKCEICDGAFTSRSYLRKHVKYCATLMKKRQYKCPLCPKRYINPRNIRDHMKTHNRETVN